jgi:hypothetical protein
MFIVCDDGQDVEVKMLEMSGKYGNVTLLASVDGNESWIGMESSNVMADTSLDDSLNHQHDAHDRSSVASDWNH